jgi:hypothetical protein
VSSDGKIIKSWFGAYSGDLQREVEEYFKTHLPGIVGVEPKSSEKEKRACETCDEEKKPQP